MNISRGAASASLRVGYGGVGNFEISGGSLIARTGVVVSSLGTFGVIGHGASRIGIGSSASLGGDGRDNLIEYAVGSDPTSVDRESALMIGVSADSMRME